MAIIDNLSTKPNLGTTIGKPERHTHPLLSDRLTASISTFNYYDIT
jgi:hypothetical protein